MKPTIGRIVILHDKSKSWNGSYLAPAIITRVWSDICVNLTVFPDTLNTLSYTSVILNQSLDQDLGWSWPEKV